MDNLVSELLDNGALIDQRDSQGMTPLHVAANHVLSNVFEYFAKKVKKEFIRIENLIYKRINRIYKCSL